jgi:hypothetical protein
MQGTIQAFYRAMFLLPILIVGLAWVIPNSETELRLVSWLAMIAIVASSGRPKHGPKSVIPSEKIECCVGDSVSLEAGGGEGEKDHFNQLQSHFVCRIIDTLPSLEL